MAAFRRSIDACVDGIELDVQRCRSGEIVVIHDSDLKRTTNGAGLVKDKSLSQLKELSAGLWFASGFDSERIPTLKEVFELVEGRVVLNIEIKNAPVEYPGIDDDLLALLEDYPHKGSIIVSSFDHRVVRQVSRKAPELTCALLAVAIFADLKEYATRIGATVWHPSIDELLPDAVAEAHRAGMEVNVWTANSKEDWAAALSLGVDGIITDDPRGLKLYLQESTGAGRLPEYR